MGEARARRTALAGEVRRRGACVRRKVEGIEEGMTVSVCFQVGMMRRRGRTGGGGRRTKLKPHQKNILVLVFLVVGD